MAPEHLPEAFPRQLGGGHEGIENGVVATGGAVALNDGYGDGNGVGFPSLLLPIGVLDELELESKPELGGLVSFTFCSSKEGNFTVKMIIATTIKTTPTPAKASKKQYFFLFAAFADDDEDSSVFFSPVVIIAVIVKVSQNDHFLKESVSASSCLSFHHIL